MGGSLLDPASFKAVVHDALCSDDIANDPERMAAHSSRGAPQHSCRLKPAVAAPGSRIPSAKRTNLALCDGLHETSGLSHDPERYYALGTSMATPLAAGGYAVIRSALRTEAGVASPPAALIKAVLVNGDLKMRGRTARRMSSARVPMISQTSITALAGWISALHIAKPEDLAKREPTSHSLMGAPAPKG
ncbi:hypothetical protein B0T18DRAFT_395436 [Schizothecium vesticola]|uniref:Peptidase S8/S53 domain-containing protein n=1 Tax=Schizothecium vesticola TaxID=314040 RepID=A0AA40F7U8_9PEZI|nr:hypothetical protein B0T18DRAFT_395436 [Schizothecium vesticola]